MPFHLVLILLVGMFTVAGLWTLFMLITNKGIINDIYDAIAVAVLLGILVAIVAGAVSIMQ